jgi:hypothetical protein
MALRSDLHLALGTASHQHSSHTPAVCGRPGITSGNDKEVSNLPATSQQVNTFYNFHSANLRNEQK